MDDAAKNLAPSAPAPAAPPALPGASDGLWTDANVAADLGVPVELVSALRASHCTAPGDVTEVRGQPILCAPGLEKIRAGVAARMGPPAAEPETAPKPKRPKPAASTLRTEDLTISRVFRGSPRVLATRANGNEVVLQVKTAEFLKSGMLLEGCQQGTMGWYYHGRLPRMIGEQQLYFPQPEAKPTKGKQR